MVQLQNNCQTDLSTTDVACKAFVPSKFWAEVYGQAVQVASNNGAFKAPWFDAS